MIFVGMFNHHSQYNVCITYRIVCFFHTIRYMLTSKSLHLIHTINRIPFLQSFLQTYNKKFSRNTVTFIHLLLDRIKHAHDLWEKEKNNIMNTRTILTYIRKSRGYHLIPSEIDKMIHETSVLQNTYAIKCPSRVITIDIVMGTHRHPDIHIQNILQKMFMWFYTVDSFTSSTCSKKVHIYLFLTDHIKQLPKVHESLLSELHVNTAFTTGCNKETDIHIYRKEEWFKVLIHESFHNLGLDFISIDPVIQSKGQRLLQEWFHVTLVDDLRAYETYSEMCGEFMNIVFYCYFTGIGESKQKIVHNIHTCLTYESVYSMLQCAKILHHYNLSYDMIFNEPEKMSRYTEKTQVFSYYVIKCIFMVHFTDFLHLVSDWKTLKFPLNQKEFDRYFNIIKTKMNSKKLRQGLQLMHTWLQEQYKKKSTPSKRFELCTLRMSLIEF